MENYYIFRIETSSEYKKKELSTGSLRQGWGVKGLHFVEKDGTLVSENTWKERWLKTWESEEKTIRGKYNNLKTMLEMKKESLVKMKTIWKVSTN